MIQFTSSEIEQIAAAAANKAIRELLIAMGVDANDPKALLEMQLDFAHMRRWRKSVETVRTQSIIVSVGVVLSGLVGAVWMVFTRGSH